MIYFPKDLAEIIHQNIGSAKGLNAVRLRENYQKNKNHEELYSTYLLSRMPSTYAAITRVLQEIPADVEVLTALDIGSGPGTGLWAMRERFPGMASYKGLEVDEIFIDLAKQLNSKASGPVVEWMNGAYPKDLPDSKSDLVLMSYTVGENSAETVLKTIDHVWKHNVSEWLVVIEPGTPKGYNSILNIRGYVAKNGGYMYAPCKGNYTCPLFGHDWCHFSIRLERTLLQKQIKKGTLPYEDEKFSYLIARKSPVVFDEVAARVIKNPLVRSGHITLDLCGESGYERMTVSKSQKEAYRTAKNAEWGSTWKKK